MYRVSTQCHGRASRVAICPKHRWSCHFIIDASAVLDAQNQERGEAQAKWERYCREQRQILRELEDLKAGERRMYELDDSKDQVMTALKLALVNLGMWVRDHYFPPGYAQATWHRLAPFFRLPGTMVSGEDAASVELGPFNDRRLNRDLSVLCVRVADTRPRLPDDRDLLFGARVVHRMAPRPAGRSAA